MDTGASSQHPWRMASTRSTSRGSIARVISVGGRAGPVRGWVARLQDRYRGPRFVARVHRFGVVASSGSPSPTTGAGSDSSGAAQPLGLHGERAGQAAPSPRDRRVGPCRRWNSASVRIPSRSRSTAARALVPGAYTVRVAPGVVEDFAGNLLPDAGRTIKLSTGGPKAQAVATGPGRVNHGPLHPKARVSLSSNMHR